MSDLVISGPLSANEGFRCTAGFRGTDGLRRVYALGYETADDAKEAAVYGAKEVGYVEPPLWKFWGWRISLRVKIG